MLAIALGACSPVLLGVVLCSLYGPLLDLLTRGMQPGDQRISRAALGYARMYMLATTVAPLIGVPVVAWWRSGRVPASGTRFVIILVIGTPVAILMWFFALALYMMTIDGG